MAVFLLISAGDLSQAIAKLLIAQGATVIVASRSKPNFEHHCYLPLLTDIEINYSSLVNGVVEHKVDCVISTIGLLHDASHLPEKSITLLQEDWFLQTMRVNCLFNLLLLAHLTQALLQSTPLKFIALSARVGSISDNQLGGWISYRVSKAALNMGLRTVAIEWKRLFKQATVIGYHPGTVATKLSRPFLKNATNVFTSRQAAGYLLDFIPKLCPEMSGNVYDWKQDAIPF